MAIPLLASPLHWESSYDAAIKRAKAEHKGIMVFIEADNCPYCERMKEEVLEQSYISNALKNFIPLKLNINSKDAKKHFSGAYVTPTTYFITADKKMLEEMVGYTNEEFFFWRIDSAEHEARKLGMFGK